MKFKTHKYSIFQATIMVTMLMTLELSSQFMEPHLINNDGNNYTSSFIAHWGNDTASIETFTFVGNNLYGKALHLYPEPHMRQFSYYFNADGSMRNMDVIFLDIRNTSLPLQSKVGLPYRIQMNAIDELVDFRVTDKEGEKQFTHHIPRMDFFGGWIPIFSQWQVLIDLFKENRLQPNLKFVNYIIGDYPMDLYAKSDSTFIFNSDILQPITIHIDDNNKIKMVDAIGTPWNYKIYAHEPIDLEDYCSQFAAKEVMGDPSPTEEYKTKIGNAEIAIRYGRPSKRGREIFGHLVPYDRVWRTGAGLPTLLTTSNDLNFNGTVIPKGQYNLFTIPGLSEWTLIFNTEKEAWGSAYHGEYDFAKVKLKTKKLNNIVEQLKISVTPSTENRGIIRVSWDQTSAEVEFKVMDK